MLQEHGEMSGAPHGDPDDRIRSVLNRQLVALVKL
jgi:hypothetical protein